MTTAFLVNDLMRDEGLRLTAYRNGGGVMTIGYGHTGREVRAGFAHTLESIRRGDWTRASARMLASRWAEEVGARAARLAALIRTGSRAAAA
ncbi:MAG: glycoside hydrolase family protein [Caulobacteraceae bacterium]